MAIDKLLTSRSEIIIKNLPEDTSEHAKYIYKHSEKIIEKINKNLREANREIKRKQFYAHLEAEKIILTYNSR